MATYFSQADSRWANKLYTSTNNKSQTMKSSGCGPTSAAMIINSLIGPMMPDVIADIFAEKGFRTANNGTNWNAWDWIANNYGISMSKTTNIDDAVNCLHRGGMVVVSCGKGLFTTSGHYIVLAEMADDNTIIVHDPYLYQNKFNLYNRNEKVKVVGTEIYVTMANMNQYGAVKQYWCYEPLVVEAKNKTMYVTADKLNIRYGDGVQFDKHGYLEKGDEVTVYLESNNFAKIGHEQWVCLEYLSTTKPILKEKVEYVIKTVKAKSGLHVREKASIGSKIITTYKYGTKVKVYSEENGWAKGTKGYMSTRYLK